MNFDLNKEEYDFLNDYNVILLTLGGSHAYGTNNEKSDIDVRGIVQTPTNVLLGLNTFEVYEDKNTDTVLYTFNKIIELLSKCNPNVIEMLGCKSEHYLIKNETGQQLIDNSYLFLSKLAIHSFGSYAYAQLNRLRNGLDLDGFEEEKNLFNSLKNSLRSFNSRYEKIENGFLSLDLKEEVVINCELKNYSLRQCNSFLKEFDNIIKTYNKINHRNRKTIEKLDKHVMHLFRLYMMAIDILENEKIVTYRDKEHDFLMSIRNGLFGDKFEGVEEALEPYVQRFQYACENTNLPEKPDMEKIEEFMIECNRKSL